MWTDRNVVPSLTALVAIGIIVVLITHQSDSRSRMRSVLRRRLQASVDYFDEIVDPLAFAARAMIVMRRIDTIVFHSLY